MFVARSHTAPSLPPALQITPPRRTRLLADGRIATLRPVRRSDAQPMQRFVQGLSASARRQRFHAVLSGCSPALLSTLTSVDGARQVAYVATLAEADGERIVAEARYVVTRDGHSAEFALVVADGHRGQGLADALLDLLFERARARGLQCLFGEVMAGNAPMLAFMQRRGFIVGDDGFDCDDREFGTVRVEREVEVAAVTVARPVQPPVVGVLRRWLHSGFDLLAAAPRA